MSHLPLFPELDMISYCIGPRKPHPKQIPLWYSEAYTRYNLTVKAQTPWWADKKAITEVYREAVRMTMLTGCAHVVDHIVPLQGGIVRGLHVACNLRVVLYGVNAHKGARTWPNMPAEQVELAL